MHALNRGPHKSCYKHLLFRNEEFVDMINKGQWIVLPYLAVQHLPGLRVSPPGVVPQRERRPRWICDYSWWGINHDTLPLAALDSLAMRSTAFYAKFTCRPNPRPHLPHQIRHQ